MKTYVYNLNDTDLTNSNRTNRESIIINLHIFNRNIKHNIINKI